jgi:methionine-rich copper-binding protein CopC
MYRVFIAIAVVAAAIVGFAATASAHARFKSSTPGKGEVVQTSPSQVEIFFTQAVQKVSGTYGIEVARDRGAAVTTGPAVIDENDRTHMTVQLQPNLTPGRYVVQWKNVSD